MEVAEIWLAFGAQIYQDFLTDYPDVFSGIVFIFDNFSVAQKKELYSFLVNLVGANHSPERLAEIWYASGAGLYVKTAEMPQFFS